MKNLPFIPFIIIFGLVACNGQAPTATPSPVIPTQTPQPTLITTLDITKTPTLLNTPDATMRVQATLNASKKICPKETIGEPYPQYTSPDEKWAVVVCTKGDLYPILKFINSIDGRVYSAEDLSVYSWTQDGAFVYLLPAVLTRPSGVGSVFRYDSGFYHLNLDNGETTPILLSQNRINYSLTISPNDKYLVYAKRNSNVKNPQEEKIHFLHIDTGEDVEWKLDGDYVDVGLFAWSLDGERVAFAAAGSEWFYGKSGFTVFLLDIKKKTIKIW